jgi:hypothetical protein
MEQTEAQILDWRSNRRKRFTASELHKLMGVPKTKSSVLTQTASTYIYTKAAELLTGTRREAYGAAIDWGNMYEKEAYECLAEEYDDFLMYHGQENPRFYPYGEWSGGSPDAVSTIHVVEFKCPFDSTNHLYNCMLKNNEDVKNARIEHYWQMQLLMIALDKPSALYGSYDPRFPPSKRLHVVEVKRDPVKDLIDEKLGHAAELFEKIMNELKL